ncbi:MAG: ABC-type transport system involved in Fe-S cluster assembly fused permease/ATPase subunit [Halioglobus sp.]|jgi:ABC-type transport system involved in Fe-S cluster assembly fused permease/ATPase subunit
MQHGNYEHETDAKMNWRIVSHLIPYLLESRNRVALAMLCLVLAKGAILFIPFVLKYLVDSLETQGVQALAPAMLVGLVIAYGAARFSNVFFGELRDTIFGRVTERAMRRIGLQVFRHVHSLDLDFHLNRRTGGLARDIERGITGISFLMRFFVFNIIPTLLEIALVVGILLANYGANYALITVVSVAAYAFFSLRATQWRTQFVREMNEADSSSNTRSIDSLLNFETVKYFTNEDFEAKRYDTELEKWEQAKRRNRLSLFGLNGGQALIIAISQTCMVGLAAFQVNNGQISLGDFILINQFMIQLFMPLGFLGFVFREIKGSLANIERLFELLDEKRTVWDAAGAVPLVLKSGEISFRKVSFAYDPSRVILKDVDFTIEPGQKVAVVGASGAGKSTLVKLLFRFYDPSGGGVFIDGQDIRTVTMASLRNVIGIVPQDTVLFNDTIFENVRYGNPIASDEEVLEAIRLAHLEAFIAVLPEGRDTMVGERGLKLSGGEKQRVSIARTILKRPPIMVFDEATSSLDSKSEREILAALEEISKDRSSLVIAHRLSTIINSDSIVVLHEGSIVEQGTHQQLLDINGHYADLWYAQLKQREQP